ERREDLPDDSLDYFPSGYKAISAVLRHVPFKEEDVFVDLGCGKGRILFEVAGRRLKKIVGVELSEPLCEVARSNLHRFLKAGGGRTPIDIQSCNVTAFDPSEGTIFYMFNPFGLETMKSLLSNIRMSLLSHPREIRIVYNNPVHASYLDTQN